MRLNLLAHEPFRFLLAGTANTIVAYGLYLLLLQAFPYRVAYSMSFVVGVVLGYTLNARYVFRAAWSWRRLAAYPLVYVVQYALGLVLLTLLVERGWASEQLAPLVVVVISLPVVFVTSRFVIKHRSP
jgi:putative flippase GtrA